MVKYFKGLTFKTGVLPSISLHFTLLFGLILYYQLNPPHYKIPGQKATIINAQFIQQFLPIQAKEPKTIPTHQKIEKNQETIIQNYTALKI
ncbi:hypothetical protein [Piscirickettsia litoralis]|uniref:Uncharacterized protein n=1 Tax=Piscirickettsia litoralis TaxID=1891921 RepID=A0ABX3A4I8_9GAMM|nr:hypothetical protein [Piscirickettsia litoralis]ODN43524.1 hypothetical protein BGC07_12100 [Piscirickettsia litoralis]